MSYLLDTNVVSELRKGPRCNRGVAEWVGGLRRAFLRQGHRRSLVCRVATRGHIEPIG